MNNTTIYQQLQQHYQKLQERLAKAQTKGRSQSFQARLLGRIQRCSMQMKHLGAGVAVIAALGWSAPVLGQTSPLDYVELTGGGNPVDSLTAIESSDLFFVDIDGDGDQDVFERELYYVGSYIYDTKLNYYENVGNSSNPQFSPKMTTVLDTVGDRVRDLSFVDIDGDGDQDLFVTGNDYYATTATGVDVKYYENTGSASAPTYTLRTGAMNPLQDAVTYINGLPLSKAPLLRTTFVDVDGDNDKDCVITPFIYPNRQWPIGNNADRIIYYENTSLTSTASYQRQTGSNNPFNNIATSLVTNQLVSKIFFWDGDSTKDGDLDITITTVGHTVGEPVSYHENSGTMGSANYMSSAVTPLDSLDARTPGMNLTQISAIIDLDNDGRSEVISQYFDNTLNKPLFRYFKETASFVNVDVVQPTSTLSIYPNPSIGVIQLEKELTGQLIVSNIGGSVVYSQYLNQAQQLDLRSLNTGVYFLSIKTLDKHFVQKLTIVNP
ncbi:MAG: T9SS type A sorting domain-containing protein [Aureispira sp.]